MASTAQLQTPELGVKAQELMKKEQDFIVGGFTPVPAYIVSGKGSKLYDADGKEYIDFIAAFSAGNLGQCHPKLVEVIVETANKITIANGALRVAAWPEFAEMVCKRFGYDKVTAAVSGSEAADAAVKIARKWGLKIKKIPREKLLILGVGDNYHGLSSGIWPIMDPSTDRDEYGVYDGNLTNTNPSTRSVLRYGHLEDMEKCLAEHHQNVAAVLMECIHGHSPSFQNDIDYARDVSLLCKKYGIMFISDEIRMGAGKTGRWLCSEWLGPDARPDMLILGKSISGGAYPASYILGMNEVMSVVSPYTLGGTFTHTPMGLACTVAAMKIIDDEGLVARALNLGNRFIERTKEWPKKYACIEYTTARGADIFIAVTEGDGTGRRYSALAMHKGLLTHPTKGSVRMSLPLNIPDEDFEKGLDILEECAKELPFYTRIAGGVHETFPNMDR